MMRPIDLQDWKIPNYSQDGSFTIKKLQPGLFLDVDADQDVTSDKTEQRWVAGKMADGKYRLRTAESEDTYIFAIIGMPPYAILNLSNMRSSQAFTFTRQKDFAAPDGVNKISKCKVIQDVDYEYVITFRGAESYDVTWLYQLQTWGR
ncbi:hypothetical protein BGX26_011572 [Mortierella sp. AD094]|nr:hypothetical protein BGX26_011572 [Mortierella sp. AD094]